MIGDKPACVTDDQWNAIQIMDTFYRDPGPDAPPHRVLVVRAIRKLLETARWAECARRELNAIYALHDTAVNQRDELAKAVVGLSMEIEQYAPKSCGRCGHPDARCDAECAEAHAFQERIKEYRDAVRRVMRADILEPEGASK